MRPSTACVAADRPIGEVASMGDVHMCVVQLNVQSYLPGGASVHLISHVSRCREPVLDQTISGSGYIYLLAWFLGLTRVNIPNGISIGSAVFAGRTS